MGLFRLFGVCAAVLFASSVGAVTIDVGPSDFRNFGPSGAHTQQGIRSSFSQPVRLPPTISGPTRILPVSRNPIVPYSSAARAMRPFTAIHPASAAASAAITGLFLAMEWYFDEDIGEWSVREVETVPPIEGTGWRILGGLASCTFSATGTYYPSPQAAGSYMAGCYTPPQTVQSCTVNGLTASCRLAPFGTTIGMDTPGLDCPSGTELNLVEGVCQAYEPRPVIEGEFERLAGQLPSLPPGQVAAGTGDAQRRQGAPADGYVDTPMTGPTSTTTGPTTSTSTNSQTGDTTVTESSTTTTYDYGDTTITTTTTTTSTTYENGQETQTETIVEGPGDLQVEQPPSGGAGSSIWPEFCVWAKVVCDWIDWTQEPPPDDVDLPQLIDEDYLEHKNISFGSKACPPDYEVNLSPFLPASVGVSFQPLCDFASIIYYMVMAASYVAAAYISIGVARNG